MCWAEVAWIAFLMLDARNFGKRFLPEDKAAADELATKDRQALLVMVV